MPPSTEGTNKAALVRNILGANPGISPDDVVKRMKDAGMEVAKTYVYNISSQMKTGKPKGKPGRKPKGGDAPLSTPQIPTPAANGVGGGLERLNVLNTMVKAVGGLAPFRETMARFGSFEELNRNLDLLQTIEGG